MGIRNNIIMTFQGFRHINKNVSAIRGGQQTDYDILQTSHRLEKGLCIREPRKAWGYDKAARLVDLIGKESKKEHPDEMAVQIGKAVLNAYIASKETAEPEEEKLAALKKKISAANTLQGCVARLGGTLTLKKEDLQQDAAAVSHLFNSRHSIRDYDDTPVDPAKLESAVELALRAPSACNRQASQVYVLSGEERKKIGGGNTYHADKYLIITGNMGAFKMGELNDWIVSTSIFCGYLSLALHAVGIGSCIFRKDIIRESEYNDAVRRICHIPADEQIILEMAIGNLKEEFRVPVSCRRKAKEILHYHD